MKQIHYILIILASTYATLSYGQNYTHKIGCSPYTHNFFGKSIDVSLKWYKKKHAYYSGIGILLNPPDRAIRPNRALLNKAYATSLREHIIIRLGYEHIFFKRNKMLIKAFAEMCAANTKLKIEAYYTQHEGSLYNADSTITGQEQNLIDYQNPNVTFLNANIGLGFEAPIFNKLNLECKAGLPPGIAIYKIAPNAPIRVSGIGSNVLFCSFSINYEL